MGCILVSQPARVALALLVLAILAPPAPANVPRAQTKTNTVRVPASGSTANGTLTTKVTGLDEQRNEKCR